MVSFNYVYQGFLVSLLSLCAGQFPSLVTGQVGTSCSTVTIAGVVFCKSCPQTCSSVANGLQVTDASFDTFTLPLTGAKVRLVCKFPSGTDVRNTTSLDNGKFSVPFPVPAAFNASNCAVFLDSSPNTNCSQPFYPQAGSNGAPLYLLDGSSDKRVYSPGFLLFGPQDAASCNVAS